MIHSLRAIRKINLQNMAYFSALKKCAANHHVYHADHHKLTTISPSKSTTKCQNPLQKRGFAAPDFFWQKSNLRASSSQLFAVTVDR
jgi:hypothetical protein